MHDVQLLDESHEAALDTCMLPDNPTSFLLSNKSDKKMLEKTITIAPGENKFPTNWLRNKDFEAKAFPCYFPSGRSTLSETRAVKLSTQQYFTQRIMNIDNRFCSDPTYLFAAQQRVEREYLEKSCDLFFRKGKVERQEDGFYAVNQSDVLSVFQRLRGTSQYWRVARSEMLAKIKQLGPFHLFFTLSCAETRWPEVSISILKSLGHVITTTQHFCNDGNVNEVFKRW